MGVAHHHHEANLDPPSRNSTSYWRREVGMYSRRAWFLFSLERLSTWPKIVNASTITIRRSKGFVSSNSSLHSSINFRVSWMTSVEHHEPFGGGYVLGSPRPRMRPVEAKFSDGGYRAVIEISASRTVYRHHPGLQGSRASWPAGFVSDVY